MISWRFGTLDIAGAGAGAMMTDTTGEIAVPIWPS